MSSPTDGRRPYNPPPRLGIVNEHPSLLTYGALRDLPVPIQVALTALLLPYEAAVTSVRLLKVTEELLGELVLHLRALRPAVATLSQAYADGHFDPVLRGLNQLQQSTDAIAYAWAPLTSVRDAVIPGTARRAVTRPLPPEPAPVRPAPPYAPASPTMADWIGGVGGRAWEQAVGLPGFVARQLRPDTPTEPVPVVPAPVTRGDYRPPDPVLEGALGAAEEQEVPAGGLPLVSPVLDLAKPLIPSSVRKLFGG